MMNFEELESTRKYMLSEFQNEQDGGNPYRSKDMTPIGKQEFAEIMKKAITNGNEESLANDLSNHRFWNPYRIQHRNDKPVTVTINPENAAKMFALTEFNTWYVRGLAKKLMGENQEYCEVYRAEPAYEPRPTCQDHEGKTLKVVDVYNGHRARYWPELGNSSALSIPVGPNCHHTIRRVKK